ncbi:MAG: tryptophan 7-halogenase, partial [Woeseiaceae bacterium]|nr:tryptophan 7-halogenase [Woeseiaceae bacterium]
MNDKTSRDSLSNIVVVGSGAEAAAVSVALGVSLKGSGIRTTLVSPSHGQSSTGVARVRGGDSAFHGRLGIDENELMKSTAAVYSLGSRFNGFVTSNDSTFVPLGAHGMTMRLVPFHHHWIRSMAAGDTGQYNDYSLTAAAAERGRFEPAKTGDNAVLATVAYDLLVDLDLYTHYCRRMAQSLGVKVVNDDVSGVNIGADGCIEQVRLVDGTAIDGNFFIDCSTERFLAGSLDPTAGFEDWSEWLHCDRFLSVLSRKQREPSLFTLLKAMDHGWLQCNTLQNFTVYMLAFCSDYLDDTKAKRLLESNLVHSPVSSVELATYRPGRYSTPWVSNCVAIGPAAIAIEPLNVSSLQLAQNAALRLLGMLPAGRNDGMLAKEFNRMTANEHIGVRDLTILTYHLAGRHATPFWAGLRNSALPDSLQKRVELFRRVGRVNTNENEWLGADDWLSCMINFGLLPDKCSPLVDMADAGQVRASMLA